MAAFHLRDIPDETYARLRARAARNGRSINAEVLGIVERELGLPDGEELLARLRELHAEWTLPPDAPRPEDIIREDRDSVPDWL